MFREHILSRLKNGDSLLLDGGMGTELLRRGVSFPFPKEVWSGTAVRDAPDVIRQIHEEYLLAGADIVTTNSFATSRAKLSSVGLGDEMEEFTRTAAHLACEARDKINPQAYVAGSLSPPETGDLAEEFAAQSAVLAEAGVDILMLEYLGSVSECVQAVRGVSRIGRPVFLGIRILRMDGTMQYGETIEELVAALAGERLDMIYAMCSQPLAISAALPRLRANFDVPVGAYAHNWDGDGPFTPEKYTEYAHEWVDLGAQVIGGCCGTTPKYIGAIRPVVKVQPSGDLEPT